MFIMNNKWKSFNHPNLTHLLNTWSYCIRKRLNTFSTSGNGPYPQLHQNKNGGDSWGTLYREPMGRLVLHYKKSKNLSGEAYIL